MRGSVTQQGIWFTEQACRVGTAYHMPLVVSLDGDVDVDRLTAAVDAVVARHPLLSQKVVERDGVPYLTPSTSDDLCRFTVTRKSGGHTLRVVAHHLVFDGGSKDILVHDLAAAYRGTLDGTPVPYEPEDLPDLAAAREFWAEHWHGRGELVLPGLRDGGDDPTASHVELDLSGLDTSGLGVTRFELLTAAWCALLHRYGNEHAIVGIDLGTRTDATRQTIGPFANELPIHIGHSGTFRELAAVVRARLRATYPFRAVPLGRAVPGLPLRPAIAHTTRSKSVV